MIKRLLVVVLVLLCASVLAQSPKKITIATVKGDTIEGTLRTMTTDQIVVEIAGQQISIPMKDVKYLSFIGRIESSSGATGPALDPMASAFEALKTLRTITEVGVLREQYSATLIETVPVIKQFTSTAQGWNDVREAMDMAVAAFREPMDSLLAWKNANYSASRGNDWAAYAEALSRRPGESTHSEAQGPLAVLIPGSVTGRLGFGDRTMPSTLDSSSQGAFNDVVTLIVPVKMTIELTMNCEPCVAHLTLADSAGKKIYADSGGRPSVMGRPLEPGTYTIWAGTISSQVGEYKLDVAVR